MGIEFDPVNKYILITYPTTELTALDIYNAAMDWADDQANMAYDVPMEAVGKFDMGGGVYSDSIFMLVNDWKIKFWSGDYQAVITGTLLPEPGQARTVPPDTGNVEVVFSVSSQATVIEPIISEGDKLDIAGKVWDEEEALAIKSKTDNLPSDPASESSIQAVDSSLAAHDAAIKAKTENLPSDPASQSGLESHVTSEVDDLITRDKGLDKIHDNLAIHEEKEKLHRAVAALEETLTEIKGITWTNETLKAIKEAIDEGGVVERRRARFAV